MSRQTVYWPQPVKVEMAPDGHPATIESVAVDVVREEWLVEDRWWTPKPPRRWTEVTTTSRPTRPNRPGRACKAFVVPEDASA